ncbi:mandelate racemase/muconate lactonizing enzyme family protein [Falsiroseomonas oryzae]|uniref:mandelate racemase/muconate lactonizing enzyme family protein n=1 Tax=Falsiroseomonas oryzae TaxID=2766473 RepID=UPI0022EAE7A8|nr:mandelate racemase/muconate lactonizing enzyme family protein [Roseomonas sp. MO-31]
MPGIAAIEFRGINVTPKTNWCFLEVRTADGRTGLGECTLSNQEGLLEAEAARLAANVAGEDARHRNRLARLIPHAPGGLVAATVLSAFDQSLADLAAQRAGQPLHLFLGGALRDPVPLYANINRGANPRSPEGFAAAAQRAVAQGFRAVKLAPFEPLVWEDGFSDANRAAYAEGLARIAAVRAAVGPGIEVMVDAHWRFSPGGAAGLVRDVAEFRLFWLECPVAEANRAEIRRLRGMANDRGMRLAGAESLAGLAAYRPVVEAGCYDVLMPDAKHAGGLEEIRRIAALAQTAGIEIAPHNPTGPVCHAYSVHLSSLIPNFLLLEVQFGETEAFFDIVQGESLRFADGAARLPQAPGLGVQLAAGPHAAWTRMDRPWLDPRLG